MADEHPGGTPPAGTPPAPPAGTPPDPTLADGSETISLDAARKLRQENQSLRERAKRLEELEAAEQQRKDADLSAADKAAKAVAAAEARASAAEARAQQATLAGAVRDAAARLHFHDPGDALALLAGADLGVDPASGEPDPDKLDKALAALLKKKTYLAPADAPKTPAQGGPPTNPARPTTPPAGPIDWKHLPTWGEVLSPPGPRQP